MIRTKIFHYFKNLKLTNEQIKGLLLILENLKPVFRFTLPEKELSKFKDLCKRFDFALEIADFKMIPQKDIGKGNLSNKGRKISLSNNGYLVCYISKKNKLSKKQKLLKQKRRRGSW